MKQIQGKLSLTLNGAQQEPCCHGKRSFLILLVGVCLGHDPDMEEDKDDQQDGDEDEDLDDEVSPLDQESALPVSDGGSCILVGTSPERLARKPV